jgi:hypothetical protein
LLSGLAFAADHGDAPNPGFDRAADLADVYFFIDPNDSSRAVLIMTITGFIVPGENVNFGLFDPNLRYSFRFENTGDARPDRFIDVRFSERRPPSPQEATITLPDGRSFTAPATNPSSTAAQPPPPTVTADGASGVEFFAGQTDDPFFFDIPGFGRFVASVGAGVPNPSVLQRGRDTFAGYNILAIALSLPTSLLRGPSGDVIGVVGVTERRQTQSILPGGRIVGRGRWVQADRMANPAVNVALIPFAKKNAYNAGTTLDDADLVFASDIIATLRVLGTNDTNIGLLASVAVLRGDFLRLNIGIPNTGSGGGNNPQAAFPNGRRLRDDVIDILMTIIANGATLGDSADANELAFRDQFPFLAPAHAPREPGTIDDQTRN